MLRTLELSSWPPSSRSHVPCMIIHFTPTTLFPNHNKYLFGCTTLLHIAAHAVVSGFLCWGRCSPGARRCPACRQLLGACIMLLGQLLCSVLDVIPVHHAVPFCARLACSSRINLPCMLVVAEWDASAKGEVVRSTAGFGSASTGNDSAYQQQSDLQQCLAYLCCTG